MSTTTTEVALPSDARNESRRDVRTAIEAQRDEFARGLPAHIDADRFVRGALNALQSNPKLAACTRHSLLATLSQAAQLGLEVNDVRGQCFLIPRKGRRQLENGAWVDEQQATLQLGWKGLIDLAARSGIIVEAGELREHDVIDWEIGTASRLTVRPKLGNRGRVIGYYSAAHFADGRSAAEVMSLQEMEDHRDKFASSRNFKTKAIEGPWVDHFDAMARKSVIRKLLNRLPQAVEFSRADAIEAQAYDPTPTPAPPPSLPANVDGATGEIGAASTDDTDANVIDAEVVEAAEVAAEPAAPPLAEPPKPPRAATRARPVPTNNQGQPAGSEYGDIVEGVPTNAAGTQRAQGETPRQVIIRLAKAHHIETPDDLVLMCSQIVGEEIASLTDLTTKQEMRAIAVLRGMAEDEAFVLEAKPAPPAPDPFAADALPAEQWAKEQWEAVLGTFDLKVFVAEARRLLREKGSAAEIKSLNDIAGLGIADVLVSWLEENRTTAP
jgi:recombination protein RecT